MKIILEIKVQKGDIGALEEIISKNQINENFVKVLRKEVKEKDLDYTIVGPEKGEVFEE